MRSKITVNDDGEGPNLGFDPAAPKGGEQTPFGINSQVYYLWLRRYRAEGLGRSAGSVPPTQDVPACYRHRSGRKDHPSPKELPLRPDEDLDVSQALPHDVSVSSSEVWRILKRLGLNRLPAPR